MSTSDVVAMRRMLAGRFPYCFTAPGEKKFALHPNITDLLLATHVLSRQEVNGFLAEYMSGPSYYKAIVRDDFYRDLDGKSGLFIDSQAKAGARRMLEVFDMMEGGKLGNWPRVVRIYDKPLRGGKDILLEARGEDGEVVAAQSGGHLASLLWQMGYRFDPTEGERGGYVRQS